MRADKGMSMRDALDLARELGCEVTVVRRTGEYRFRAPSCTWRRNSITVNGQRRDASQALVGWLRRVEKRRAGGRA